MPEGAECKLIGESLAKMVGLRRVTSVEPVSGRYIKKPIDGVENILGAKVVGVGVKGKLLFWIFDNDHFLLNTLGMSGAWSSEQPKNTRVRVSFDTGNPVYFMDPRGFGTLKVIYGRTAFLKKLESLGPDMLTEPPSLEVFTARLDTKPNWTICKALMDQSVVSGIGSRTLRKIVEASLVDEDRIIGSLSSSEIEKLYIFAKKVLAKLYQDNLHES
jgi:formamidopyrimidine-DNA glycosylase